MSLGEQFEEIGKTFNQIGNNIPHIKVGSEKNKPSNLNTNTSTPWKEEPPKKYNVPNEYPKDNVSKVKNFLFWFLTTLISGIALILIIRSVILKIFR